MVQVVAVAAVAERNDLRNTTGKAFAMNVAMMLDMSCTLVMVTMKMMTVTTELQVEAAQKSRNEANIHLRAWE